MTTNKIECEKNNKGSAKKIRETHKNFLQREVKFYTRKVFHCEDNLNIHPPYFYFCKKW